MNLRMLSPGLGIFLITLAIGVRAETPQPLPLATEGAPVDTGALIELSTEPEFLPVDQAFKPTASQDGDHLRVHWQIADGYYLYKDRISISDGATGQTIEPLTFKTVGKIKQDEYFGEVEVFLHEAEVEARPPSHNASERELKIRYQGCAEAGLCYPPQTLTALFIPPAADAQPTSAPQMKSLKPVTATQASSPMPPSTQDTDSASGILSFLQNAGTGFILLMFFILGIGLSFTPCVFPMIPILSSIIAGQKQIQVRQAFVLSLSYVLGMATTYALAGVIVGSLGAGANLQAAMQQPWLLGLFSGIFVLLALSMFGFYELQLPAVLRDRLHQANEKSQGGSIVGVAIMGALSALVVSPCVSAPLAGALIYISTTGDALLGGAALLALGLGMGMPLLAIGTGGAKLLPRAGAWMESVKVFFGVSLLGVAIWLLERIVPPALTLALWAALLGIYAVYLGAFNHVESGWNGWQKFRKGLGLLLFIYAALLLAGASSGASDPLRPLGALMAAAPTESPSTAPTAFISVKNLDALDRELAHAKARKLPVIVDFYADWCISCKVMERTVLNTPEVNAQLANFHLIKADVTEGDADSTAMLTRYALFGPPGYLFYDREGNELPQHRVMGEMNKQHFLSHLGSLPLK